MDEETELNEIDESDYIIIDINGLCPDLSDLMDSGLIPCVLDKRRSV